MTEPEETARTLHDDIFGTEPEYDTRGPRVAWESPRGLPGCRDLGAGAAGTATFILVDGIMMWAPLSSGRGGGTIPQAITLLVLAFGLGSLLVWNVRGAWRPYGFGLMIGWGVLTLISVGYLTGVNP